MKNFLKILLVLLFMLSCDSIDKIIDSVEEDEAEVTADFHINNGFEAIENQEFEDAIKYFNFAYSLIDQDNLEDFSYSLQFWHGISWSQLLFSNTLEGLSNADERLKNRKLSYDAFFKIDSLLGEFYILQSAEDLLVPDISIDQINQYKCDMYAGKILYSDYRTYYYQNKFFNVGALNNTAYEDSLNWFSNGEPSCSVSEPTVLDCSDQGNCNGYCELGIANLIGDMASNSCYTFSEYAPVDLNDINLVLIKDYIRNERYQDAYDFIAQLNREAVKVKFDLSFSSSSQPSENVYLIGDFLNKTIDSNLGDSYLMIQEDESPNNYSVEIDLYPSLPCNFISEDSEIIRDELLECVNTYFNSDVKKTFRYKFFNGSASDSGQESGINGCSDEEDFRLLEQLPNNSSDLISVSKCYNSCLDSCD